MKKLLTLSLALLLSFSILTGCVSGKDGGGGDESEPEPPKKVYYQECFTGEEQGPDYAEGQRPVAVMIDNIMSGGRSMAWPQKGLSKADVVFEMETEGGITRMLALFRDWNDMTVTGPIRSARDQFVQMMLPFGCLYVHDGGSTYAKQMLYDRFGYEDNGCDLQPNTGVSFRDANAIPGTDTEHTEYVSGQKIADAISDGKKDLNGYCEEPDLLFNFVKYDEPARVLSGPDVSRVDWLFSSSYSAYVEYDPATNKYTKTHHNRANGINGQLVDAENGMNPVEFDNVFILWTEIDRYPDSNRANGKSILSRVDLTFGGYGYYFNGGKVEKVRWLKGQPNEKLRIVGADGMEFDVAINVGTSYIAFVDLDNFGTFEFDGEPVDASGDYLAADEIEANEGEGEVRDEG